jgi:hypothetical protein
MNYIKDSSNYYILYIRQNEDFDMEVTLSSLGISSLITEETSFSGELRRHASSLRSVPFTITVDETKLYIKLDSTESGSLTSSKYSFDIFMTNNNKNKLILSGEAKVTLSVTRI